MNGQSTNNQDLEKGTSIQRNTLFNLDEIKVRWKKAALENCPGVPCVVSPPAPSFTCGTSTITDIDNNIYNTVLIGTQCWTKENLKVTKYNNGTSILLDASGGSAGNGGGQTWSGQSTGAYTIYGNESSTGPNATNYGFLYNWYAVADNRGLCPTGWHVPNAVEWSTLVNFLGSNAGGKMKSTVTQPSNGGWDSPNSGATNQSGFSGLPGGYRVSGGRFDLVRNNAEFWSATEITSNTASTLGLLHNLGIVGTSSYNKQNGHPVRCLINP